MPHQHSVIIDQTTGEVESIPTPAKGRYRAKLDTVADTRRELARVYRECRQGEMEAAELTKLVFALKTIAGMIEASDFEKRFNKALEYIKNK